MADIYHELPHAGHKIQRRWFVLGLTLLSILLLLALLLGLYRLDQPPHSTSSATNTQADQSKSALPTGDVLAVVKNSGSTNLPSWTLTIHKDGSALLAYGKNSSAFKTPVDKTFPAHTIDSQSMAALLQQIGDVSTIRDQGCLKSISFGSTTTVTFNGKTSGDISCISGSDHSSFRQLRTLVQEITRQIHL